VRGVLEQLIWAEARARARRRNCQRLGLRRGGEIAPDLGSGKVEKLLEAWARARRTNCPRLRLNLGWVKEESPPLLVCPGPKERSCSPTLGFFLGCLDLEVTLGFFILLAEVPWFMVRDNRVLDEKMQEKNLVEDLNTYGYKFRISDAKYKIRSWESAEKKSFKIQI
jgi:hypothetical protein